jgi:hypothetical protein
VAATAKVAAHTINAGSHHADPRWPETTPAGTPATAAATTAVGVRISDPVQRANAAPAAAEPTVAAASAATLPDTDASRLKLSEHRVVVLVEIIRRVCQAYVEYVGHTWQTQAIQPTGDSDRERRNGDKGSRK